MKQKLVSRRTVLAGSAAAGAIGLVGIPAWAADVDWKKFAGTKLEVILAKGPRGDNLQKYAKEFTDLTGIQVESEQIPEQQQRQKVVIELASGKPSFDVVHLSYHVQKRQFEKGGWLADLTPYMKDPALTAPDLVEGDFSAAGLQYAKNENGQMLSLPWSVDYFILYYNKEMFQKKGVEVPKTLDEMVTAAEKLTDPKEGTFGFVGRGLRNANMTLWTNFFLNYGGEFLDAKGNILTDGPEAIEATKLYQTLLTKVAPPGVAGFNWMESMAAFTQGRAAMWIDGVGWAPPLEESGRVTHRRQGRLHRRPGRSQRPILGNLWRRTWRAAGGQEQGGILSALPVAGLQGPGRPAAAGRRRCAVPQLRAQRSRHAQRRQAAAGMAAVGDRFREDQQARSSGDHPGCRVPRHHRRRAHGHALRCRSGDRAEEGARAVPAHSGAQ